MNEENEDNGQRADHKQQEHRRDDGCAGRLKEVAADIAAGDEVTPSAGDHKERPGDDERDCDAARHMKTRQHGAGQKLGGRESQCHKGHPSAQPRQERPFIGQVRTHLGVGHRLAIVGF